MGVVIGTRHTHCLALAMFLSILLPVRKVKSPMAARYFSVLNMFCRGRDRGHKEEKGELHSPYQLCPEAIVQTKNGCMHARGTRKMISYDIIGLLDAPPKPMWKKRLQMPPFMMLEKFAPIISHCKREGRGG